MPILLKATFQSVNADGTLGAPLSVNYNPTEYTLNKGAQIAEIAIPGLDSPILQFVRGQTETLSLDLFFDSTDSGMDDSADSVTTLTDQFYQLVKIDGQVTRPRSVFSPGARRSPDNATTPRPGARGGMDSSALSRASGSGSRSSARRASHCGQRSRSP